jgi:RNA polymerase sigma factor (sigma-70 family)
MNKSEERIFEIFIKKHEQRTMNFLSTRYSILSEENIRDIIQDSYVTLHRNIEARKISEPQYPYFLKICMNLSLKAISKQGKHIVVGINDSDIQQKNTVSMHKVESILQVCDEQETVVNEKKMLVHNALDNMASRCRDLLWSFYADELSWATIAAQFGLKNADTAKSQASRCRQTFKEKYNHLRMQTYGNQR